MSLRKQCPDCPDGYAWTADGPTDLPCPTCGGNAYVLTNELTDAELDEFDRQLGKD